MDRQSQANRTRALVAYRRGRLAKFFEGGTLPTAEKSLISAAISGKGSFGDKLARRLELTYGMGEGYLDAGFDPHLESTEPAKLKMGRPKSVSGTSSSPVTVANCAATIIESALQLAGMPSNFLGDPTLIRESIITKQSPASVSITEEAVRKAVISLWQESAEDIGVLAQSQGSVRQPIDTLRQEQGEQIAEMLLEKIKAHISTGNRKKVSHR